MMLNVCDDHQIELTFFSAQNDKIEQENVQNYLEKELFRWSFENGPYIGSFQELSVIGVPFKSSTWGLFFASKHPLTCRY